MSDRPIIFSAPMVQALLAGRKTQTRRLLKPQPASRADIARSYCDGAAFSDGTFCKTRFEKGDRLYVREAFSYETLDVDRNGFMPPWYWADGNPVSGDFTRPKPSIHMPRWASRLTLTVTEVKVQRLQEISEADAIAEGIEPYSGPAAVPDGEPAYRDYYESAAPGWWLHPRGSFGSLWNSIHGEDAWDAENPWVVAISFTVQHGNIDAVQP